jgi:hypothetical protein
MTAFLSAFNIDTGFRYQKFAFSSEHHNTHTSLSLGPLTFSFWKAFPRFLDSVLRCSRLALRDEQPLVCLLLPARLAHGPRNPQVLSSKIDVLPIDEILVRLLAWPPKRTNQLIALQVMLSHLEDEDIDENKLFKTADQLRSRISNEQVTNMLTAAERAAYVLQQETLESDTGV